MRSRRSLARALIPVTLLLLTVSACGGAGATERAADTGAAAATDATVFCDRLRAVEDDSEPVRLGSSEHLGMLRAAVAGTPAEVRGAMDRVIRYFEGQELEDVPIEELPGLSDYPEDVVEAIGVVEEYRVEACPEYDPSAPGHEH